ALGVTLGCNPPLNSEFCPDAAVTRAEMAVFLSRALEDQVEPTTGLGVFPDVPANVWYTDAVARMVELGITTGYEDGTYRPNASVSRGEMAVFLDRAFESLASDGDLAPFGDVPTDAFYAEATDALFDAGVTLGCRADPLAYCPLDAVSRAQMASFLARVLAPTSG
ncbi:MAG: S-layer homology domain-containing protein, partial [Acidimicrobiia bacterium]|nr:S-layer homology domain-containing protein [Acidimicrobiia bacterium]